MYKTNSVGDGVGVAVGESVGGGFKHRHIQLPEPSTYADGIAPVLQLHRAAVQSVGADVGVAEGAAVGVVGAAVGTSVGAVGLAVGATVGLVVGVDVGAVGAAVGTVVGLVGVAVGACVGVNVGVVVGSAVGAPVGLVGVVVGATVGVVVGASVGVAEGGVVGTAVGESVGGGFKHRHAQLPKSSRYGDGIASGLQLHTSVVHSSLRCRLAVLNELGKAIFICSMSATSCACDVVQRKQGRGRFFVREFSVYFHVVVVVVVVTM